MKCEVNTNRSLIANSGCDEFGGCEIFHGRQNEGKVRDSLPRLLRFGRGGLRRERRRGGEMVHDTPTPGYGATRALAGNRR